MSERSSMPIARAAIVAIVAGVITAYAAPIASRDESAAEHLASRAFHVFESACAIDWDNAPVARAMFSIPQ